jgi:predicted Zn-dependent peptidase
MVGKEWERPFGRIRPGEDLGAFVLHGRIQPGSSRLRPRRGAGQAARVLSCLLALGWAMAMAVASPERILPESPPPGRLSEIEVHRRTGVASAWLDNGVRVHHLRARVGSGRVWVAVSLAGGEINETDQNRGLSQLAAASWTTPACRSVGSAALKPELERLGVKLAAGCYQDRLTLRVEAPAASLPDALHVAFLLLSEPLIEPDALEKARRGAASGRGMRGDRWQRLVSESLIGTVLPEDVRLRQITAEQVDRFTLAHAQAWIDAVVRNGPVEAAIVGDVELEEAMQAAGRFLGALPSRPRIGPETFSQRRLLDDPPGDRRASRTVDTPDGRAYLLEGFLGAEFADLAEYRALWVAACVMEDRLRSRLATEGLAAPRVDAGCAAAMVYRNSGLVFASAIVEPSDVERAAAVLASVVDGLRTDPPTELEVRKAGSTLSQRVLAYRGDPSFWVDVLSQSTYRGPGPDAIWEGVDQYAAFTVEDVRRALETYLTSERRAGLALLPMTP